MSILGSKLVIYARHDDNALRENAADHLVTAREDVVGEGKEIELVVEGIIATEAQVADAAEVEIVDMTAVAELIVESHLETLNGHDMTTGSEYHASAIAPAIVTLVST